MTNQQSECASGEDSDQPGLPPVWEVDIINYIILEPVCVLSIASLVSVSLIYTVVELSSAM